jgi:tetratricopeptide (TPR) repeat protein
VAKHKHPRGTATTDPRALQGRVERLVTEQQFQHALDLAKTLHRVTPTPRTADLLVRAALGRARQLTASNYLRDAATVLGSVAAFVQSPEQIEALALALSECGQFDLAVRVAQPLASATIQARIAGDMADAAMRGRPVPSTGLPADFHAQRELLVKAFTEVEAGRDDDARATLQGIGLTSPFLEWKVMLRGLIAYYTGDDAKALENWQRLAAQRIPARLSAPFRQAIDPAYRHQQAPETQTRLHNWYDQMQGSALNPRLRLVQQMLADPRHLAQAFRQADALIPVVQSEAPQLLPRLAACFYWAIVDHGFPEDLQRYRRIFAAPPDDPKLSRLEAMAVEHRGQLAAANELWQRYEKDLAEQTAALPSGHADRMRALVWQHMAGNALLIAAGPPDFMAFGFGQRAPLPKPSAEACYKRSLDLAPDQLDVQDALVQHYLEDEKPAKALQAGKRLLKHFPEHAPTLELCGELSLKKHDYRAAIDFYGRAVQANPLNALVRSNLGVAHSGRASDFAAKGQLAAARTDYQAARTLCEGYNAVLVTCSWAAMEFQADDVPRAEELLQAASALPGGLLATPFSMLVLAIRKKLSKTLKTRFEAEVKKLLADAPSADSARGLAASFAAMHASSAKYPGQKTHEKMALAYLGKALSAEFNESQLLDICQSLIAKKATSLLRKYFMLGQRRFPTNPQFYLAEFDYFLSLPAGRFPLGQLRRLLDKVRKLADALPAADRTALLEEVQDREEDVGIGTPFAGFFGGDDMNAFWPGDEFDDDFEDDDDWEE